MNSKRTLVALLFSVLCLGAIAQKHTQKLIKKEVDPNSPQGIVLAETEEGDKLFHMKGVALGIALEHYMNAYHFDARNPTLNYKIGVCYLNTINKVKAIPYLEKAEKLKPNISRDIHYLLGLAYQLNMEFDKSIGEFKKYKMSLDKETSTAMNDEIEKHIQECETGKYLVQHPVNAVLENLGPVVNTVFPEYSPFVTADETKLYFTARKDNTMGANLDESDYKYYEDIYVSIKENGKWTAPVNIDIPINTYDHDGMAGLSPNGQRMFVYRGDVGRGDIFESKLQGMNWTEPISLNKPINTKYHESSACLSSDQKTLYFVSDRPDLSLGGRDIFRSTLDKSGKWGMPENLGNVINTTSDEDGVFLYADDKTLFFSSKGHETMGGYDIFTSMYDEKTHVWSKPTNIGYPINTPDDDVFFTLSESGEHGYYAAQKPDGSGELDIIMINFLGKEKAAEDTTKSVLKINPVTLVKGNVKDAQTLYPLEASIEIVDNAEGLTISTIESNTKTGEFLVTLPSKKNYGIYVRAPGYLFHSENINIPEITQQYQQIDYDILLEKIQVGKKIVLNNINYEFDKSTLTVESTFELTLLSKLMKEETTLVIEISSHTDNVGTDEYNRTLSEARAKSVVDWLVLHGIPKERLVSKGYGEIQPAASNETPEGRQQNRRTEFKVLGK